MYAARNLNTVAGSDSVIFDDSDPFVTSITPSDNTETTSPINFTVVFNEDVNSLT